MGGNCAYRTAAVAELGGFPDPTYSEDVEISLGMIARGWRTRFVRDAVAESRVGVSLRHYASQRIRWTYGMYGAGKQIRSLEALAVSSGYADRLVFAAACALAVSGHLSPAWLAVYLLAPLFETLAALAKAGKLRRAPIYLLSIGPMFLFDIGLTAYATARSLVRRRPTWHQSAEDGEIGPKPRRKSLALRSAATSQARKSA
jgi:cellulose synthase/poly-beta-1,6-N-acetylglucosamine synthase-like glycosyltransferase